MLLLLIPYCRTARVCRADVAGKDGFLDLDEQAERSIFDPEIYFGIDVLSGDQAFLR